MFWAIDAGRVDARGFAFEQVAADIETLNRWALEGRSPSVSALSLAAYSRVADRYALRRTAHRSGSAAVRSSSRASCSSQDALRELEVVIPGRLTTCLIWHCGSRLRRRAARPGSLFDARSPTRSPPAAAASGATDPRGPAHVCRRRSAQQQCSTLEPCGRRRQGCRCRSASTLPALRPRGGARPRFRAVGWRRSRSAAATARRRSPMPSASSGAGSISATADRFVAMHGRPGRPRSSARSGGGRS